MNQYGPQYAANQMNMARGGAGEPIIEVGGKLQFSLPGQPIFPALGDDAILKPAFDWILYSAQAARFDAELSYVSRGMTWSSDYNIVAPENGDVLDLIGWVTLDNQSGKQFDHARIKLMAGDVNKVQPPTSARFYGGHRRRCQRTGCATAGRGEDLRRLPSFCAATTGHHSRLRDQASRVFARRE